MVPRALQFEFTPRRRRWWLRLLLAGLCIGLAGVVAVVWWQRQTEIERLQAAERGIQQTVAASAAPSSARANPAWMAAAQQDGRDLTPIADMRLLEIERCVAGSAMATRFTLDTAGVATAEVQLSDLKDSAAVAECLNEGIEGGRWRLFGLSAGPISAAGVSTPAKAMLRFDPLQR